MAVAVVVAAAAIASLRNPEHTPDRAHGAADAGSDRPTNYATDRAGDPVTLVRAFLRAAHDALGVADMRDRQQREDEGRSREPKPDLQSRGQRRRLNLGFVHLNSLKIGAIS